MTKFDKLQFVVVAFLISVYGYYYFEFSGFESDDGPNTLRFILGLVIFGALPLASIWAIDQIKNLKQKELDKKFNSYLDNLAKVSGWDESKKEDTRKWYKNNSFLRVRPIDDIEGRWKIALGQFIMSKVKQKEDFHRKISLYAMPGLSGRERFSGPVYYDPEANAFVQIREMIYEPLGFEKFLSENLNNLPPKL